MHIVSQYAMVHVYILNTFLALQNLKVVYRHFLVDLIINSRMLFFLDENFLWF